MIYGVRVNRGGSSFICYGLVGLCIKGIFVGEFFIIFKNWLVLGFLVFLGLVKV